MKKIKLDLMMELMMLQEKGKRKQVEPKKIEKGKIELKRLLRIKISA
jgi:hypothetical protein